MSPIDVASLTYTSFSSCGASVGCADACTPAAALTAPPATAALATSTTATPNLASVNDFMSARSGEPRSPSPFDRARPPGTRRRPAGQPQV